MTTELVLKTVEAPSEKLKFGLLCAMFGALAIILFVPNNDEVTKMPLFVFIGIALANILVHGRAGHIQDIKVNAESKFTAYEKARGECFDAINFIGNQCPTKDNEIIANLIHCTRDLNDYLAKPIHSIVIVAIQQAGASKKIYAPVAITEDISPTKAVETYVAENGFRCIGFSTCFSVAV